MREVLQENRSKPDNRGMMSECRFDGVIETMEFKNLTDQVAQVVQERAKNMNSFLTIELVNDNLKNMRSSLGINLDGTGEGPKDLLLEGFYIGQLEKSTILQNASALFFFPIKFTAKSRGATRG